MIPPIPDLSHVQLTSPPSSAPRRKLLRPIEGTNDYILEIDWSSIESFITCPRAALWKLIYGRIADPSYALTYGRAIHRGLELIYGTLQRQQRNPSLTGFIDADAIIADAGKILIDDPPPLGQWRSFNTFENALRKYVGKYAFTDGGEFEVLHVEQPFILDLCTVAVDSEIHYQKELIVYGAEGITSSFFVSRIYVRWTGVIDLVVRDSNGLWVLDHKTSSVAGDSFWNGFQLSSQFMGYQWAAEQILREQFQGAIANVLFGRPPTKTGTPLELERRRYLYRPEQIAEWQSNMVTICEDFIHHLVTRQFPMHTQWCVNKFALCPYFDVCAQPKAQRLTMLSTHQYQDNVWSPLT